MPVLRNNLSLSRLHMQRSSDYSFFTYEPANSYRTKTSESIWSVSIQKNKFNSNEMKVENPEFAAANPKMTVEIRNVENNITKSWLSVPVTMLSKIVLKKDLLKELLNSVN